MGIIVSSTVKALGTARYLHAPYFASKKMSLAQQEVFVEERKYDYYAFGFTSALLESLPYVPKLHTLFIHMLTPLSLSQFYWHVLFSVQPNRSSHVRPFFLLFRFYLLTLSTRATTGGRLISRNGRPLSDPASSNLNRSIRRALLLSPGWAH